MQASRRDFLKLSGAGALGLVVGLAGGYMAWGARPPPPLQVPVEKKIKALWIYVGPIADVGWTAAHHEAKESTVRLFGGRLEAKHVEKVSEGEAKKVIETELTRERYDAVFATSYGFKYAVSELARDFKDVKFYHCSGEWEWEGFKGLPNVSTYFAEFYQLYFLNGVAAGAVTKTCKIGYVPAFLIPEVVRHINAYALGAVYGAKITGNCGAGEKLEVYVKSPLLAWFAPDKAKADAMYLVDKYDVDVLAFTEDTTAVLDVAEEYMKKGKRVYSFSHYNDMFAYYKRKGITLESHLTGQIANWTPILVYLLSKLYMGFYEKEDVWARLGDFTPVRWAGKPEESLAGKPEGSVYLAELNTKVIPPPVIAEIKRLYEEMKELLYEPFTGPIKGYKIDENGRPQEDVRVKVREGERVGRDALWYMDWFHEKIISPV